MRYFPGPYRIVPGRAPVCCPVSSTTLPLTITYSTPRRVLVRLLVGRVVDDRRRVEHRHVRRHARTQQAAIVLVHLGGIRRGHLADRLLHRDHLLVAHVAPEHARKRAEVARMRIARGQRTLRRHRRPVRADRDPRLLQRVPHVVLGVVEVDRRHRAVVVHPAARTARRCPACRAPGSPRSCACPRTACTSDSRAKPAACRPSRRSPCSGRTSWCRGCRG